MSTEHEVGSLGYHKGLPIFSQKGKLTGQNPALTDSLDVEPRQADPSERVPITVMIHHTGTTYENVESLMSDGKLLGYIEVLEYEAETIVFNEDTESEPIEKMEREVADLRERRVAAREGRTRLPYKAAEEPTATAPEAEATITDIFQPPGEIRPGVPDDFGLNETGDGPTDD